MTIHKSVLLKETIELLNIKENSVVVDATLGGGGHSREILGKIGDRGMLIAFDADEKAIDKFLSEISNDKEQISNKLQIPIFKYQNRILVNYNFAEIEQVLEILKIEKVDAILADLGWSSDQLEGKGMSFQKDEELDMRLSLRITNQYEYTNGNLNAKYIINNYSEEELGRIIKEYGEERYWRGIARKISTKRKEKEIRTTKELVELIENAVPGKYRHGKIHPATRTFQALRIEVNQELKNLEKFIPVAIEKLNPGGRLVIISFHSLEDRIVKNIFRANARGSVRKDELTGRDILEEKPRVKIVNKKPITAGDLESRKNPRARSAKLRSVERI